MENGKVKIRLQGHEKFPLREGWLNKGLTEVANNPTVFVGKEGADILGLGNNMVKSLRYWLKAFGLIVENGAQGANLTRCGELILQYDAYFEDLFSLWILHSNIVKNAEEATTWFLFFNKCDIEELDKEQIIHILKRELDKYTNNGKYSEKSMMNDVDVLLNMYGKTRGIIDPEDKSNSPFSILDLIKNSDGLYSRITPDRRMLNEWNILYELAIKMQGKEFISIMIMCIIILLIAPIAFDAVLPVNIPLFFIALALYIAVSLSIGSVLGLVVKNQAKLTMIAQLVFLPSIMLSGIMFPINLLPPFFEKIGKMFPAYWGYKSMIDGGFRFGNLWYLLLVFLIASIVCLFLLRVKKSK